MKKDLQFQNITKKGRIMKNILHYIQSVQTKHKKMGIIKTQENGVLTINYVIFYNTFYCK